MQGWGGSCSVNNLPINAQGTWAWERVLFAPPLQTRIPDPVDASAQRACDACMNEMKREKVSESSYGMPHKKNLQQVQYFFAFAKKLAPKGPGSLKSEDTMENALSSFLPA